MSGVDALIEEGRLDEALTIISAYIQKNPKDFDGAQRKIKRILKMRGDYIGLTEDLLRVIVDEPLNDEKKLKQLRSLPITAPYLTVLWMMVPGF